MRHLTHILPPFINLSFNNIQSANNIWLLSWCSRRVSVWKSPSGFCFAEQPRDTCNKKGVLHVDGQADDVSTDHQHADSSAMERYDAKGLLQSVIAGSHVSVSTLTDETVHTASQLRNRRGGPSIFTTRWRSDLWHHTNHLCIFYSTCDVDVCQNWDDIMWGAAHDVRCSGSDCSLVNSDNSSCLLTATKCSWSLRCTEQKHCYWWSLTIGRINVDRRELAAGEQHTPHAQRGRWDKHKLVSHTWT